MARIFSRRRILMAGAALGGTALAAAAGGAGYLATVDMDGLDGFVDERRAVLNAFVAIHDDGMVVIEAPRTEMGQGVHTGLAMLVAEEMDLPLDQRIRVEHPVEQLAAYSNAGPPHVDVPMSMPSVCGRKSSTGSANHRRFNRLNFFPDGLLVCPICCVWRQKRWMSARMSSSDLLQRKGLPRDPPGAFGRIPPYRPQWGRGSPHWPTGRA